MQANQPIGRKSAMAGWLRAALLAAAATAGPVQAQETASYPRSADYAAIVSLPDFTGVWQPDWSMLFGGGGSAAQPSNTPQLTPAAQARLDAFRARQAAEGVDQFNQIHCIPPGMPGIMRQPYPIELLFSPGRVTIFAETYGQTRRIYTDGRALPEEPDYLFNGNSVGHWHGDVLYIDSVGFSPLVSIAAGIPHSGKMRIQERIWLESPGVLRVETIITDPDVLTAPLVQQMAYRREASWEIREYVCTENNRLVSGEGGANIDLGLDEEDDPFSFID